MKVTIQIERDNIKSSVTIDDSDQLTNLVIIQNVFNLFGIDKDEVENSYNLLFEKVDQEQTIKLELPKKDGIKIVNGREKYQLRYECPMCKNRGLHYVYKTSIKVYCHSCMNQMDISPATKEAFPAHDKHFNFFRAGNYPEQESV